MTISFIAGVTFNAITTGGVEPFGDSTAYPSPIDIYVPKSGDGSGFPPAEVGDFLVATIASTTDFPSIAGWASAFTATDSSTTWLSVLTRTAISADLGATFTYNETDYGCGQVAYWRSSTLPGTLAIYNKATATVNGTLSDFTLPTNHYLAGASGETDDIAVSLFMGGPPNPTGIGWYSSNENWEGNDYFQQVFDDNFCFVAQYPASGSVETPSFDFSTLAYPDSDNSTQRGFVAGFDFILGEGTPPSLAGGWFLGTHS